MDEREAERWLRSERERGFIRARLRLLTTEEGGRRTPIVSGYRSCWSFPNELTNDMHDGPLTIEEASNLGLGEEATVRLHPLSPEYWPRIGPGRKLGMHEGAKLVGTAIVVEVVSPADQA
jgi:hypothetical protein